MQLLQAEVYNKCPVYLRDQCCHLIAEGIQLLRRMPVPDDATPGPYIEDPKLRRIRHSLFKDHEAHVNRVVELVHQRKGPPFPTINLEKELVFCFCDFNDENSLFNTNAAGHLRLYIVGFEEASFLPVTFLAYVLFAEAVLHGTGLLQSG
ncbi:hypothetical protein C8A03DRAFT_30606 [Achaetomium macrosporum]|uniref:Uncharacterized protein n=1 Tax=Achaetomium macrosporum TaxID=79813 RepID=A0AAN7H9F4_9PEZI|nr:hypothetical protein C8A03DRAFT_30606 [Achaetomium macrosporum]